MTSEEKETIYNLLKLSSCWVYGYKSPKFQGDTVAFDDDVIEFVEPAPAKTEQAADAPAMKEPFAQATEKAEGNTGAENAPQPKTAGEKKENGSGITLESISQRIAVCRNCVLANTRTNTVPGEGVEHPYVMVIGEGPGEDEDKSGRPFVGKAGQLLDKMLAAISLSRTTNCYIANIVKCRPPMNRTPMIDEASACSGYLQAQIHLLKPKFILAMGRTAVQNLLKTNTGINTLRGQWLEFQFGNEKIPLMATYHPSALLRDERLKAPAWQDLKKFREKLLAEKPDYAEVFYTQK
ncbi:MAG: uracil-DNA glycosylase [Spirochaetales bacterium]|nr:uracil-DNA glycosylase [Spirochaetales bacterium]